MYSQRITRQIYSLSAAVTADLSLPNGGLDPNTVTTTTVTLKRNSDQSLIPAIVNTTGGGDAIILQPSLICLQIRLTRLPSPPA